MCSAKKFTLVGAVAILIAAPLISFGAHCALRNPDRRIYELFPDATGYRTIVSEVNQEVKASVEKMLGIELRFGDLGKHTVYVVLKEGVPIGFVHARSEIGKSGSVEFVWALTLDLTIHDFRVQRSREKHISVIKADKFRHRLIGRNLEQLHELLVNGSKSVDAEQLAIPQAAVTIAHTVVLSGVKTRAITELAFGEAVHSARLLGNAHRFFPGTTKVTKIRDVASDDVMSAVEILTGVSPGQADRESLVVLRSFGENGEMLGASVFSRWSAHAARPEIWWSVTPDGRLKDILALGDVDQDTLRTLRGLRGKIRDEIHNVDDSVGGRCGRCACEILAVLAVHKIGS